MLTEKVDILNRWAEFYQELYHQNRETPANHDHDDEEIPPILLEELQAAYNTMKPDKASGPDGVNTEMLKHGGAVLQASLLHLMNLIVSSKSLPTKLKESEIVTIFKKGDTFNCANYRPINLLNHIYKVLMQIIYKRISKTLQETLHDTQAAYQPQRGTIEQIQALQQIIEKCKEFNVDGVICFIDFTKAFDSVDQDKLWEGLKRHTNLPDAYIKLLINAHKDSFTRIRTDCGLTELIEILKGVKQGDVLSALLFCIVITIILERALHDENFGISIGGRDWRDLGYADDLSVIAKTLAELQRMMKRIISESNEFGLKLNYSKTKIMFIGPQATRNVLTSVKIENNDVEVVSSFEYLGRRLNNKADDQEEVKSKISKGWQAFTTYKETITNKCTSMKTKRHIVDTYIMPVALYAAETTSWTNALLTKMKVFENHLMRWMCGKKLIDQVSIDRLRQLSRLEPIENRIKAIKLKWFGHLKRRSVPAKMICEGYIPGKRSRGRPSWRWIDDVILWTGKTITELNAVCRDRKEWRRKCYECLT